MLSVREAEIDLAEIVECPYEEAGAYQQEQRQRHLERDERLPQAHVPVPARDRTGFVLERGGRRDARAAERRQQPEQHRRRKGHDARKQENPAIGGGRQRKHGRIVRQEAHEAAREPGAEEQPRGSTGGCENHAFDEELPHHLAAAGAERAADGDLTLARRGTREQKPGDVRARNQQHHTDQPLQHDERALERSAQRRHPTIGRNERKRRTEKPFLGVRKLLEELALQLLLFALVVKHPHCRLRLREADAALQAGEQIEPRIALVLQVVPPIGRQRCSSGDRRPQLGEESRVGAAEFGRRNPDDRERRTIEPDRGSHNVLPSSISRLPEAVLEHDYRGAGIRTIVFGREHASSGRLHTEHVKEVARHPARLDHLAAVARDQAHALGVLTGQP